MLIGHYLDYREFLKDKLGQRTQANSQYSLRAFARDLAISPQVLSNVLGGKKNISSEVAIEIARKLRLSEEETSYLHDLVELSHAKSDALREVIRYRLSRYESNKAFRTLQEDIFSIISDWYHYAILELSFVEDFRDDPVWIAKRLGISPTDVRAAIGRLVRLEMMEERDGTLLKTDANLATAQDVPSAAIRKLTAQILAKADEALEDQPLAERDFGTMTMAIDPKKLPQAKKMIRHFRRDLMTYLESGKRTEVYSFASQLFRISKK